jgi:hypothetical protein
MENTNSGPSAFPELAGVADKLSHEWIARTFLARDPQVFRLLAFFHKQETQAIQLMSRAVAGDDLCRAIIGRMCDVGPEYWVDMPERAFGLNKDVMHMPAIWRPSDRSDEMSDAEFAQLFADHRVIERLRHIPPEAIRRLHGRFELGVANYGEKSWNANNNPAALTDLRFIADRIEHAKIHIEHLQMEFARGVETGKFEFTDDDPAAIMWFGTFAACAQTALLKLQEEKACKTCGGTGGVDSGGFTPWGSPIDVPCPDCPATIVTREVADISDIVREYRETAIPNYAPIMPDAATKSQCVDMLGQDVVPGDVMWNIASKQIEPRSEIATNYINSVRCPRPGESIKEFAGWREMAKAMQASGATFFLDGTPARLKCSFEYSVSRYSRAEDCTWKGPQ